MHPDPGAYEGVLHKTAYTRTFATFDAAERYAHACVKRGLWDGAGSISIEQGFRTVATVSPDALGRVWTDLRDQPDGPVLPMEPHHAP